MAEINCELSRFVSWFCKAKKKPSLTKLILTGMPEGTGKKGAKSVPKRKKRQPTESRTSITVLSGIATCVANSPSHQGMISPPSTPATSSLQLPSHPPPLIHYTPQLPSQPSEPFTLCFITGNIGVCYGCRQKYRKPCKPPEDICVCHKVWREYFSPGAALPQTK